MDPLRRMSCLLLWRAPLLLPLLVVVGVIIGGSLGWMITLAALAWAHFLRMRRVLVCSLLCGFVVGITQSLRSDSAAELQHLVAAGQGGITLQGTVVRELSYGCMIETSRIGARVAVRGDMPWQIGDVVRVTAQEAPVSPPAVEGMYSAERWMRGQGICANLTYLHGEKLGTSYGWSLLVRLGNHVRQALSTRLMPPGTEHDMRRQVLCALVLGDKDRAEADTMNIFRRGGCLHTFAVSGMHVGIIAAILGMLLRLLRVHPSVGRYLLLGLTGVYVIITGLATPALRAYLMLAALLGSLMLRRRLSLCNAWCCAALIILMLEPWQLFQAGFQLSFIVYAAIGLAVHYGMSDRPWFGPDAYIPTRIRTRSERIVAAAELSLRGVVIVALSAWLVSLPLSIAHFHTINSASYLTNIAITPLLPIVMLLGLLSLVCSGLPLIGAAIHYLAMQSAGIVVSLVSLFGAHPLALMPAQEPAPPEAYILATAGQHGHSFCLLGNPGILVGDVQAEKDARYTIEPAIFHSGFSVAGIVWPTGGSRSQEAAKSTYLLSWPQLQFIDNSSRAPVNQLTTQAGTFTLYYPPGSTTGTPIVLWQQAKGLRIMYIGHAALSTLEAMPYDAQRADVIILGYNPHEPLLEPAILRRLQPSKVILLPSAASNLDMRESDIFPARLQVLGSEPIIHR